MSENIPFLHQHVALQAADQQRKISYDNQLALTTTPNHKCFIARRILDLSFVTLYIMHDKDRSGIWGLKTPSCVIRQGSNQRRQGTNLDVTKGRFLPHFSRQSNSSATFEVWLRYGTLLMIRQSNVTLSPLTLLSLIMLNQRSLACLLL